MQHTITNPPKNAIEAKFSSPKILIAEDNVVNQKLISLLFSKLDIQVDVVANGREAVEAALTNCYDMILMDIQMPVMDGIEACNEIKNKLKDQAPVIVALTANTMNGDREKYIGKGMDHYLAKPVSFDDIKLTIAQFTTV